MMQEKKSEKRLTPYKASGSLILNGALTTIQKAKTYHALLVCAAGKNWEYDERGRMVVKVSDIHRLTNKTCASWQEYRDVLDEIRKTAEMDWDHLSELSRGRFRRSGKVPLLSESHMELDLAGEAAAIVFRISQDLVEDLIKPHWYGQVNTTVLFRIRSNYTFHAYLFACLTVIEKDSSKEEFYSQAYPLDQWREILGAPEGAYPEPSKFRAFVFRRTEKQIKDLTKDSSTPLEIEWIQTPTKLYQMKVKRLAVKKALDKPSVAEQVSAIQEQENEQKRIKLEQERMELIRKVAEHPRAEEIKSLMHDPEYPNFFEIISICQRLGIDDRVFD